MYTSISSREGTRGEQAGRAHVSDEVGAFWGNLLRHVCFVLATMDSCKIIVQYYVYLQITLALLDFDHAIIHRFSKSTNVFHRLYTHMCIKKQSRFFFRTN